MFRLKDLLSEADNEDVKVLRDGLRNVRRRSHLVSGQIKKNIDEFIENLSIEKFQKEFGKIKKFLGAGVFGAAFELQGGKVLKFTFDYHEAPFLHGLSKSPVKGMVNVDKALAFSFGDSTAYGIVRDPLTPAPQSKHSSDIRVVLRDLKSGKFDKDYNSKIKKQAKTALMAMYDMDPSWRGTHLDNLGIQNGRVVLFDGFSKGVEKSALKVPKVNLQS